MNHSEENKGLFNPFPGLRPFGIEESHLFFGREGQSEEVLNNLSQNRFVAVIGSSGSGKSSLMYCGLVPILHGGFITEAGSKWKVIVSRPGNDPIGNLAEAIAESEDSSDFMNKSIVRSILESSSLGLIEAIKQLDRDRDENILLLADQFEELFRFKKKLDNENSVNESHAFVKLLLEAIKQTDVPIYVIMTMRSDFIGECSQYQELTQFINDSHYLIPQMTRENLRSAIIGPVAVGGARISEKLVNQLLNDVGDNPDQLPILQHALMRTFDYWKRHMKGDEDLDIVHYDAIGRMETALSNHANEAYDELTPDEKRICENTFKTLTEKGSDNRGIRHPSSISEIASIARTSEESVIKVVDKFRSAGRSFLTSSEPDLTPESIIDISHESLMRIWDKLKIWVDEESLAVQMYIRLSEAATMYQLGKTGLWRPPDLHLAVSWRKEKQPTLTWAQRFAPAFERTMVYLETSEKEYIAEEENKIRLQKRAIRRSRIFAIVLGTAAIISLGFMILSIFAQQEANKQKELAVEQTEIALQKEAEAKASEKKAKEQEKLAQIEKRKAEEEKRKAEEEKKKAEEQRQIANQQTAIAERNVIIARQKSLEALQQTKLAEEKSQEALEQKNQAEIAKEDANKLRMLSIAQSMAVKSVQILDDDEKKSLLAYQAYMFNKEYGGRNFHPDIYDGLYYSLKSKNDEDFNTYIAHSEAVRSIALSSNGVTLYSAGSDGKIFSWDMGSASKSHKELATIKETIVRDIAISNNENWLAAGTDRGELVLVDVFKNKDKTYREHTGAISSLDFTTNNKYLVTGSIDSTIIMWNVETGEAEKLGTCGASVRSVTFSPDDKYVACACDNGQILLVNVNTKNSQVLYSTATSMNIVTYNRSGSLMAFGDKDGVIYIWDVASGKLANKINGHRARINDIQFSPNDELLATASFDGTTKVWQTSNYNLEPIVLKDHESWVLSVTFSTNNNELLTACMNSYIKRWDIKSKLMAEKLKEKIERNMTQNEWATFVGKDIPYEKTIEKQP